MKVGVQGARIAAMNQMIPLGRGGLPEEAAGAIYLFCSPDSDFVSGQTLVGTGGIKGEPPEGDTARQLGPMKNPGMGAFYLAVNRNKRSIVLDLKQPAARDALLRLGRAASV